MTMQETLQNHNALLNELPESLGATLTRARLSKKLELREAASRIGVDLSVIQALEEDDFQHLGAPVFTRNYLLRYARLLELPEDEILDRYRQMGLDEPPPLKVERPIQRQARMTDIRWLAYPVVVVGVLWLSYLGFERLNVHYSSGSAQRPASEQEQQPVARSEEDTTPESQPSPTASANPMAPALAAIADFTGLGGNDSDNGEAAPLEPTAPEESIPPPVQEPPITLDGTTVTVEPPMVAENPDTPAVSDEEPAAPIGLEAPSEDIMPLFEPADDDDLDENTPLVAVANLSPINDATESDPSELDNDIEDDTTVPELALPDGQHQLALSFDGDCWVEVRDASGERLVRAILNANTVNRFVGEAPFTLTLGNAAAVTGITLNGQSIDASVYSPTRGNVSRFTLEAPSG